MSPSWKGLALRPLGVLVAGVVVLNAAGWLVDASPLRQEDGSWGFAFAGFFLGLYAVPVLVLPSLLDSPAGTAFGAVAVGVAAALCWPLVTCVRR